ncbi:MAG: glycoside hydrolase family 16 protein [Bacteroidetes bacterium]|nr:glycoside hydrolase family 16 protein [Bacteroidota bacterium]
MKHFLLLVPVIFISMTLFIKSKPASSTLPFAGDTLEFSGHKWLSKESNGKHTGPGHNYFSGSKENVYVDDNGKLHLRLTYRNDKWYCPEVRMLENLGYGSYIFHIDSLITPLDRDIVVGLFMYDHDDTLNFHNEVDIEFSQWGKDDALNTQYVIQPKEAEAYRFNTDFKRCTRHVMEVRKRKIVYKSYYEKDSTQKSSCRPYSRHTMSLDKEYKSSNEKVSINVWLYRMSEPSNLKEFEIVFSKFEFKPFPLAGFIDPKPNEKE